MVGKSQVFSQMYFCICGISLIIGHRIEIELTLCLNIYLIFFFENTPFHVLCNHLKEEKKNSV